MAYEGGKLPIERASKIAHMELIRENSLVEMLQSFHSDEMPKASLSFQRSGSIDINAESLIKRVVTVDGGFGIVPHPIRREKTLAFIQVGTCLLYMTDLLAMKANPMMDPRDVKKLLERIHYRPCALPLSGVRIPGQSIRDTIRRTINGVLSRAYTGLYPVLEFLVHRRWLPKDAKKPVPEMECFGCDAKFTVPERLTFSCPHCGHEHFFADYLHIGKESPEEWSRQETAIALMAVIETLALFEVPVHLAKTSRLQQMSDTLFIKDGPLLLRAYLSRLVEPIRDFIEWVKDQRYTFHMVGIEKTGDFVRYLDEFARVLPEAGDYFVPSVRFMIEDVAGAIMNENTYRNRVSYGSKVAIRLSTEHVVPLSIPTGASYPLKPTAEDLIGFSEIARTLSQLTSAQHDNALIPLVLANRAVSISQSPSGNILHDFVLDKIK
ncbi:MAG: hypothetical protein AAFY56_08980 [Pseudomonadota bacterium]